MNKFKFVLIIFTYLSICAYSEWPSDFNERISNKDFNKVYEPIEEMEAAIGKAAA